MRLPKSEGQRLSLTVKSAVTIVLQQLANGFEPLYDYDILTWMTYNPRELS